jgi:glycosyltransferase involved in cell wall biosynthesis
MRVTVAVCTWNRCEVLAGTLEQFTRLVVPPGVDWDLLVVDNGSTDRTTEVVQSFADRLPIRAVVERTPGLSHARNRALQEAAGAYLMWTDDDVLVEQQWLGAFADTVARYPGGTAFGGPIEPWFPIEPDPVLLASFPLLRHGFCGVDHGPTEGPLSADRYIWGANMAFKRAGIEGLAFDPALGVSHGSLRVGEDKDFINRVRGRGGAVIWSPAMRVRHRVDPSRMTARYLVDLYSGHGRTWIRESGIPIGRPVFGAPRWLWRKSLTSYARYAAFRLASQRTRSLSELREFAYLSGAIKECRLLGRDASS